MKYSDTYIKILEELAQREHPDNPSRYFKGMDVFFVQDLIEGNKIKHKFGNPVKQCVPVCELEITFEGRMFLAELKDKKEEKFRFIFPFIIGFISSAALLFIDNYLNSLSSQKVSPTVETIPIEKKADCPCYNNCNNFNSINNQDSNKTVE